MSHEIEVDSDVKSTIIREKIGNEYNEENNLAVEKIVQDWVNQQPNEKINTVLSRRFH